MRCEISSIARLHRLVDGASINVKQIVRSRSEDIYRHLNVRRRRATREIRCRVRRLSRARTRRRI